VLLPDAKSQVTVLYEDEGKPSYIDTVLVSTQHVDTMTQKGLEQFLMDLVKPTLLEGFAKYIDPVKTKWLFNPAGLWTLGGPAADTGLSGRKIVVDNYGADCPIGGGSFSGKDPTKVDRSAAYAARHVAKNLVAAGGAKRCQVQLSYAIGVVDPVSIRVQTFGTGEWRDEMLTEMVKELVPLSPKAIIDRFKLRRPIYAATASGGHFGRDGFPWEALDLVDKFKYHMFA
jgi:S-adenosylmethionine synthetase